jgi:hypothetical protein
MAIPIRLNDNLTICKRCGFKGRWPVTVYTWTPTSCPGLPFGVAGVLSNMRQQPCFCSPASGQPPQGGGGLDENSRPTTGEYNAEPQAA